MTYTVANPADAPQTLTFGPKLIDLAATYAGRVTLGLNRRLNNIANTISAAALAKQKIGTLHAIELGNEPDREYPVKLCSVNRATILVRWLTLLPLNSLQQQRPYCAGKHLERCRRLRERSQVADLCRWKPLHHPAYLRRRLPWNQRL